MAARRPRRGPGHGDLGAVARSSCGSTRSSLGGGTSIYGPLAAPIVLLIWLYALAIAVLIGAAPQRRRCAALAGAEERALHARLGAWVGGLRERRTGVASGRPGGTTRSTATARRATASACRPARGRARPLTPMSGAGRSSPGAAPDRRPRSRAAAPRRSSTGLERRSADGLAAGAAERPVWTRPSDRLMSDSTHSGDYTAGVHGRADVAQLVERNLAKVEVAGSSPVVRSEAKIQLPSTVEWPRGEATACKAVYTGSNPVSTSRAPGSTSRDVLTGDWRSGSALP